MKVLVSAITYYPTIGGADDYVRSIAEGVAARGHDVTVVASDLLQHVSGKKIADAADRTLDGVRVLRCASHNVPGHIYPVWPGLVGKIRSIRPDIVHAFGLGYFSADGPCLFSCGAPVVVSATGGRYRSGGVYSILRATVLRATERAAVWTALSESERATLRNDHPRAPVMRILPPSVEPREWSARRPDPFPEIPAERRILYAGRIAKDKGIDDLASAFAIATRDVAASLVVVGPDYGFSLPDAKGIYKKGPLDRETLLAAYQNCAIGVLPSRHEGFGIALLEAMAAGMPVVGYNNSAIPELVSHEVNGLLVPTGDVEGLAAALKRLITNDPLARQLGDKGRARAMNEFARERMIDRCLAIYNEAHVN